MSMVEMLTRPSPNTVATAFCLRYRRPINGIWSGDCIEERERENEKGQRKRERERERERKRKKERVSKVGKINASIHRIQALP